MTSRRPFSSDRVSVVAPSLRAPSTAASSWSAVSVVSIDSSRRAFLTPIRTSMPTTLCHLDAGVAADATPGERREQLDRAVFRDAVRRIGLRGQPPSRADLGETGQPARQQLGLAATEPGGASDRVGKGGHRDLQRPLPPLAYGGLVAKVGLEHQPERATGIVDELEVRRDASGDAVLVVVGGGQRR